MSQESATPTDRDALDGLLVRWPRLVDWTGTALGRMRSGSALRRRLLSLSIKRGFDAMARSDLELVLQRYEPNAEVWMRGMAGVGISGCYRGHEGVRALYAEVDDAFEAWRWTIRSLVDGGDRLAIRADFFGVGRGSGVETTMKDSGTAMRFSARSAVTWQEWFVEQNGWQKAVEAAGLSE
jgi:ketosteroid isomerase-like protein